MILWNQNVEGGAALAILRVVVGVGVRDGTGGALGALGLGAGGGKGVKGVSALPLPRPAMVGVVVSWR